MNQIIIKGRLTRDPEIKELNGGNMVCTVSVAVDRKFSKERATDFFNCVFWRQTAEFVSKYFKKGQEIIVRGSMQSREYEDREGKSRTVWELQAEEAEFSGGRAEGGSDKPSSNRGGYDRASAQSAKKPDRRPSHNLDDDDDDDVPF